MTSLRSGKERVSPGGNVRRDADPFRGMPKLKPNRLNPCLCGAQLYEWDIRKDFTGHMKARKSPIYEVVCRSCPRVHRAAGKRNAIELANRANKK